MPCSLYTLNAQFYDYILDFCVALVRLAKAMLPWLLFIVFPWVAGITYKPRLFLKQCLSLFILHVVSWSIQHDDFHRFLTSLVEVWGPLFRLVIAIAGGGVAGCVVLFSRRSINQNNSQECQKQAKSFHGKPMLFACRTTHIRFSPKKHSFSYSYLLAGVPVGWHGPVKNVLSVDTKHSSDVGWFNINAEDYLERGGGHLGLDGKLEMYLIAHVSRHST